MSIHSNDTCDSCRESVPKSKLAQGLARELESAQEVAEKMHNRVQELEQAIRAVCRGKVPVTMLRELVELPGLT